MPDTLKTLLNPPTQPDALPGSRRLIDEVRRSPATPLILAALRAAAPDLRALPATTYTLFREFEHTGVRDGYQAVYFARRAILTRAVFEILLDEPGADQGMLRDAVHDALWAICEETTWLLPAHEEQGPDFWELKPSPRQHPLGAHTALTREPDSIDLFAAETGASLAEAVHLLGDRLAPEVVQRVRQEVARRIFRPYLAYGRRHWWYKGALNWNGVCNGSIGLAFMRLEQDPRTLAEALAQVLEGFEAYIATGFEADGGSIEGIGYWNYGLMYYVTLAELLRERTGGKLDLLAAPRMADIARYPLAVALSPGVWVNFGDATEQTALAPGTVSRLADRTGVQALRGLLRPDELHASAPAPAAKLAIVVRDAAWWDGAILPFPAETRADAYLLESGVVRLAGETADGRTMALAAKAGHNDGHHSHTDVAHFIIHVDGESLLCDPGRGLYSKEYFRQTRYDNIFCNSFGHSVPRIGGRLQQPGPEFGGEGRYRGEIIAQGREGDARFIVIDFDRAYDAPGLSVAQRMLRLEPSGEVTLEDHFEFNGPPQEIEEAFVTWADVRVEGARAHVAGRRAALALEVLEPAGATFTVQRLEEECRANRRDGVLTRLAVALPPGSVSFRAQVTPARSL